MIPDPSRRPPKSGFDNFIPGVLHPAEDLRESTCTLGVWGDITSAPADSLGVGALTTALARLVVLRARWWYRSLLK